MRFVSAIFAIFLLIVSSSGQSDPDKTQPQPQMSAMQMQDMQMPGTQMKDMQMPGMSMSPTTFIESIEDHSSAGTSAEPISTDHPMLMTMRGHWALMFHGVAFINDIQQSGARGGGKFFSSNWFMPMAQRK